MKKPKMDQVLGSPDHETLRTLSRHALASAVGGREWIDAGAPEVVSPPRAPGG